MNFKFKKFSQGRSEIILQNQTCIEKVILSQVISVHIFQYFKTKNNNNCFLVIFFWYKIQQINMNIFDNIIYTEPERSRGPHMV